MLTAIVSNSVHARPRVTNHKIPTGNWSLESDADRGRVTNNRGVLAVHLWATRETSIKQVELMCFYDDIKFAPKK
jgi:hypothetical protein